MGRALFVSSPQGRKLLQGLENRATWSLSEGGPPWPQVAQTTARHAASLLCPLISHTRPDA